jgi:hypothetical protein
MTKKVMGGFSLRRKRLIKAYLDIDDDDLKLLTEISNFHYNL